MIEKVLAVKSEILKQCIENKTYSLIRDDNENILRLIKENCVFLPRENLEMDITYRQVIPYCIIHHNDNYLLVKRLKTQSESRLHGKLSIGFGGHINLNDYSNSFVQIILNGLRRELNEEISIEYDLCKDLSYIGVINDESCSVSQSHIGLLFEIELHNEQLIIMEVKKMTGGWENLEGLIGKYNRFEDWTKIVFDQYIKK